MGGQDKAGVWLVVDSWVKLLSFQAHVHSEYTILETALLRGEPHSSMAWNGRWRVRGSGPQIDQSQVLICETVQYLR